MSGRQSFAFQAAEPVEAHAASTGRSAGAQIVGGRSQGGVVTATPQTNPGPMAGQLGEFFGQLMQPYVERKQQEKFFEGFAAAAEGRALSELSDSHNPITKIFGPSSFAEGAQFYAARKAVTDWGQQQLADMDNLKLLDPAEVPKKLAERARAAMTGDPYADQLIQRALIEQAGPLTDTIAKKRVEHQQQQAVINWQGALGSAAGNLQSLMDAQADVTDPADPRRTAAASATQSLLGMFVKPEGMTDESYKRGLKGFLRSAAQAGNFHAITALRKAGIDTVFDDEEQTKLEDTYHRYAQRVMHDRAGGIIGDDLDAYEVARQHNTLGGPPGTGMSAAEARQRLLTMNAKLRAKLGIDEDLFDFNEIRGEVRSTASLLVANYQREQDRRQQLADKMEERRYRREEKEQDRAEEAAAVGLLWSHGDATGGTAADLPRGKFDQLALRDYRQGNYGNLAKNFGGGFVSSSVKDQVQGMVKGSLDEQWGSNTEKAYKVWKGMVQTNPGMAAAYFGDYHDQFRAFDTMVGSLGPAAAYRRAFGDTALYSKSNIPPEKRKAAGEAITRAVTNAQPGILQRFTGMSRINKSGQRVIQGLLTDQVAVTLTNSDLPEDAAVKERYDAATANGSLQEAGAFRWRAAPGTARFHARLGLLPAEAGQVFMQVVDERLKKQGYEKGAYGDNYEVAEMSHGGVRGVFVQAYRDDGGPPAKAFIPMGDFKAQQIQNMKDNPQDGAWKRLAPDQQREAIARGFGPRNLPPNWRTAPVTNPMLLIRK